MGQYISKSKAAPSQQISGNNSPRPKRKIFSDDQEYPDLVKANKEKISAQRDLELILKGKRKPPTQNASRGDRSPAPKMRKTVKKAVAKTSEAEDAVYRRKDKRVVSEQQRQEEKEHAAWNRGGRRKKRRKTRQKRKKRRSQRRRSQNKHRGGRRKKSRRHRRRH